jgi:hypothetical protein
VYWEIDGLQVHRDFYDTERKEECGFSWFSGPDGLHHCLPNSVSVDLQTPDRFSDKECSTPLTDGFELPSGIKYGLEVPTDPCAAHERLFQVFELPPSTHTFHLDSNGTCYEAAPLGPGTRIYAIGPELALSKFVTATEQPQTTTRRITRLMLSADDGAQQILDGWDSLRKEASSQQNVVGRWGPSRVAFVDGYFSDDKCSASAAPISDLPGCPPNAIVTFTNPPDLVLNEVGERAPAPIYRADTGQCLRMPDPEYPLWALGKSISEQDLEPAREVLIGGGPARMRYFADADLVPILPLDSPAASWWISSGFLDTAHDDEPCSIVDLGNGEGRCLPDHARDGGFSDASCTTAIWAWDSSQTVPSNAALPAENPYNDAGTQALSVHRVGAPIAADSYFVLSAGECTETDARGMQLREIGDEVPLREFSLATLRGLPP